MGYKNGGYSFGDLVYDAAIGRLNANSGYDVANTQVISTRDTGWGAWTGAASKATSTATVQGCAEAIKALFDLMLHHGLAGS